MANSALTYGGSLPAQTLMGGRLTLATGTPVTTTDQTSKSTIYYTPYIHDQIGIYNGTSWDAVTFTELSLAISGLTSGKNYDLIVYKNSGTTYLDLMPAWTNDTTRASAIAMQNGVWTNSGSITTVINSHTVSANRGTVVGTMRTTGTNTTEDSYGGASQSGGKRFLWNMYHRVERFLGVIDTTDTWTYGTASWRQANNASGNKVEYVCGLNENPVHAQALSSFQAVSGLVGNSGVGVDSTTVNSSKIFSEVTNVSGSTVRTPSQCFYNGSPGLGYHYIAWLEYARSGTATFEGDLLVATIQSGLIAKVWS